MLLPMFYSNHNSIMLRCGNCLCILQISVPLWTSDIGGVLNDGVVWWSSNNKAEIKAELLCLWGNIPHLNAFVCSVVMHVRLWGILSDQTSNFHIFISLYKTVDKWYGVTHSSSYLCADDITISLLRVWVHASSGPVFSRLVHIAS